MTVSSSEAIERLKEQGVTFQDGPEMGLFADMGLLPSFANSDIQLLAAVTKLKAVRTHGSATNDTLQIIATLDQLEMLAVTSPISDADLQPLSTMGNLRTLILWSDKLTAAAVGRLKSQMGKCDVVWKHDKTDEQP